MPVVSLFSGSGGLDTGFRQSGFNTVIALDNDPVAVDTFNANHPPVAEVADLASTRGRQVVEKVLRIGKLPRGVIGGPPCQAFSTSNVHVRADDPRAKLIHSYASIVKALNEAFGIDFFLFENVAGLTSERNQPQFYRLLRSLEKAGFNTFSEELDAQFFGVPQMRPRRFIVGINRTIHPEVNFAFPNPTTPDPATVRETIGHLKEPIFFERGLDSSKFPEHPNHWAMQPRSRKFAAGLFKPGQVMGRSFRVLDWDRPSWTVAYGHREMHIHPSGRRRVSVYEAMLFQGFPTAYRLLGTLSDQIRLVSDAVPPPLAAALAQSVRELLYSDVRLAAAQ
ncbi:MAG: DNA cytosine methyltransferase [Actinobacteria bacterium]|nr:DNA cytosine methyltransferase [Actinomycetota bacterium]